MIGSLEKSIRFGFAAALIVLGVVAAISITSIRQLVLTSRWEEHTREVLMTIAELSANLMGAETASRDYVISGDERYLAAYRIADAAANERLRELRDLTADNPRQVARLDRLNPLVREKLAMPPRIATARRLDGIDAAGRMLLGAAGESLTRKLNLELTAMRDEENSLLRERSAAARADAHSTTVVISCGGLLAVLLVGLAALVIHRDMKVRRKAEGDLRQAEERLRLLIEGVRDHAIFMLDPSGRVVTWNSGAQQIKGYAANEIIGEHFSRFYPPEDIRRDKPGEELQIATATGSYEEEGWRVRKDGSRLWASVVISALRDNAGHLLGFAKVTRDVTQRKHAEDDIRRLNEELRAHASQLESANKELEAFCYSVSHDLRAPLRSIDGFSLALAEDYADKLDAPARNYLQRVRAATQRMARLIDDLLNLSRVSRSELSRCQVDLSATARAVVAELRKSQPDRQATITIADGLTADADPRLVRIVLDNLLGNAWKFTGNRPETRIEFAARGQNGTRQFFVRDNGAGFDMAYVHKLFGAFQRLHGFEQFPGTGVGLATVQRIIHRHGGRISAEGEVDKGATFSFTL
ncbi:MAG TPA: CHASE3 domain-containing protein [Terracidiphilus sp.]|nr:CHASE3 domain-containing protein [Terracidiphilus sp.]